MCKNKLCYSLIAVLTAMVFSACGGGGGGGHDSDPGPGNGDPVTTATYEAVFLGPGGHSNGAYGRVNALHAAARAVKKLEELAGAAQVKFFVKEIRGGNSVNAIASDGYIVVGLVEGGENAFQAALTQASDYAMQSENDFRGVSAGATDASGLRLDIRVDSITRIN